MLGVAAIRLSSGAAPALREFADLSGNEARIVLNMGAGSVRTAAEAMRVIGIDQAAISRSVKRLIERQFVTAQPDRQHAKRILLSLAEKGRAYARAFWRFNKEREDVLLSGLPSAERAQFIETLVLTVSDQSISFRWPSRWRLSSQTIYDDCRRHSELALRVPCGR